MAHALELARFPKPFGGISTPTTTSPGPTELLPSLTAEVGRRASPYSSEGFADAFAARYRSAGHRTYS